MWVLELLFMCALCAVHGNLPRELAVCFLHRGEFGFCICGGEFGFLRAAIDGGERGGGALAQSCLERTELCLERAELLLRFALISCINVDVGRCRRG